jgi:hypothetical protein
MVLSITRVLNKMVLSITRAECNTYTAISIKVVHEQSGKVEYERERLLGIVNKFIHLLPIPEQPFALVFDFFALLGGQP